MSDAVTDHKRVLLRDIAEPTDGAFVDGPFGSNLKSDEYVESGVRLIQLQNIGDGYWKDDNKKYITDLKFRTLARHGAIPGDIAIAKMADPVARACIVPHGQEQYVVVADCIRLRVDEARFDPRYIVRAINSHGTRTEAERKSIGSTRIRINLGTLKTVGCLVPQLRQQQAVAEILDTLDTTIRQTEAIIEKLKQVKQGLLHDLLTRGIDANGELRPPKSQAPHLYKDSPLGWIPREWGTDALGRLAESSVIGPFGSDLVASDYRTHGVPVVFVRDVKPDRFEWKSNVFVSVQKASALSAHEVRGDDVVATKMGLPPCVAAVYPESMASGVVTADIVRLRFDAVRVRPHWVSLSINEAAVMKQVEQITAGVTRPKVTLRDVRNLCIRVPNVDEQDRILARMASLDRRIEIEATTLSKLGLEKSGLMDDLLTGRVRVTPLLV